MPSESFDFPFKRGEVLGGKYRVLELLGVGGVGFVVAALHLGLDNYVALKFLKPEFVSNPEALRSFMLEARASFKIKSEHVARVHDVDALANGMPFIVMELLNGQDLRRILQRQRYLPIARAVDFALQSCDALAAAHALRIVHRDVKPENLAERPAPPIRRTERPSAPTPRVPTGTYAAASAPPVRRLPTVNPLAAPPAVAAARPPQTARMQSVIATPAPLAVVSLEEPEETTDVSDIPGLRPGRARLFFFAATVASIAFAVAYSLT